MVKYIDIVVLFENNKKSKSKSTSKSNNNNNMEGTKPIIKSKDNNMEGTPPNAYNYGGHPAPAGRALPNLINAVGMLKSKPPRWC